MTKGKKPCAVMLCCAVLLSAAGTACKQAPTQQPAQQTSAQPPIAQAVVENTSKEGGEPNISLTAERSFEVKIPVALSEEDALKAAETVEWVLLPDKTVEYLNEEQYPNRTQGGALDTWMCADGETPFFDMVKTDVETKQGQVYLTLSFTNNCYFGDDFSVPHINGGSYMDVCGYFRLVAKQGEKELGETGIKILPYDKFHTMAEINEQIEELVDFAGKHTDLYVEQFSMGQTQGDNGMEPLDMPYIVVAKDKKATENWKELQQQAQENPTALLEKIKNNGLGEYQVPIMYSNVHANETAASDGILEFAWMLVNAAAEEKDIDYQVLTGFTEQGSEELKRQMGNEREKGSLAIPDLVKDSATYLGFLKGKNPDGTTSQISTKVNLEDYYTTETQTVDVNELLEDVFFIIVPEENTEGRTYLTRTSSGGFDLNRDNSFQTQAETQNMARLIAQWNPVSFTEFHGRIETFQCEPCDPPHEPNFEYDLLAQHLLKAGEALGIAAIANNDAHNSYVMPQRDYLTYTGETQPDGTLQTEWVSPWDDMSTSYTPQYAMLHGILSYTVEVPAYDDAMVQALAYGQLGQSVYIAQHKQDYLTNQTKVYERGVTNTNSNGFDMVGKWFCDRYDVEGAEAELFRPEYNEPGQNGNFYPECYIIPMDGEHQSNLSAAADMMEYLARNGVKVYLTNRNITHNGEEYPTGTLVVPMYQAKRSVANGVLYDGTVITNWPVLYSEGITAFNHTRGFDMAVCAEPKDYEKIKKNLGEPMNEEQTKEYLKTKASHFEGEENAQVILLNVSEDSTAAVNDLLGMGKSVSLITQGEYQSSFLCSYEDWASVSDKYLLSGIGTANPPAAQPLKKAPVVYISGKPKDDESGFVKSTLVSGAASYNYDRQALRTMGFLVTEDAAQADLIVGASKLDEAALEAVKSGTPYIGYGSVAVQSAAGLFGEDVLVRQTVSDNAMDALAYVTYPNESPVTASYQAEGDMILYGYGAGYFEKIPDGAKVLVQLDGSKELLEGFLPQDGEHYQDFLNDSVQAISYQGKGAEDTDLNVVLFANTLTNKTHQRDEYAFISNMAFACVSGQE